MSENTCPNVALSRNQNMWVVKESATKRSNSQPSTDIINVTPMCSPTQPTEGN